MPTRPIHTIDDVIRCLDEIILHAEQNQLTFGYFAVLYRAVTIKVKEGIQQDFFDDGPRMERLDVIFAKRYIDAYYAYQDQQSPTQSWQKAFLLTQNKSAIVLQHLLIGINAHINLDLGIAAAEVAKGQQLADLRNDFNKINAILAALVQQVEENLSRIWHPLKKILVKTQKFDDLLVNFSMELARDGAWTFAESIAATDDNQWRLSIQERDLKISRKARTLARPAWLVRAVLWLVWVGEKGSVTEKIKQLGKLDAS